MNPPSEHPAAPSLIRPLQIGPYRLANNLLLAPMAGITDRPFRTLCRRLGAGLAVAEMVAANTALWGSRKSLRRLDYQDEPGPISAQIVGADPAEMAAAARLNVERGAHIIDINMGCPAKKVCKVAAGSALLRDEQRVARILEAVVAAVAVPVTLKIRTGWSPEARNAVRIAQLARESGIAALTVHGRTRACTYGTPAEYDTIRAVREAVALPLIANGDIASAADAQRVLHTTGAAAIMIGRAAQGRPWLFRDILAALDPTQAVPPEHERSRAWMAEIVREHLEALYAFYGEYAGVRMARKHIAWYCRDLPDAARFRTRINQIETASEQLQLAVGVFEKRDFS